MTSSIEQTTSKPKFASPIGQLSFPPPFFSFPFSIHNLKILKRKGRKEREDTRSIERKKAKNQSNLLKEQHNVNVDVQLVQPSNLQQIEHVQHDL